MHLGLAALLEFYRQHSGDEALVLGTVVATEGSTYRKPGAMMLIAADDSYRGLISGGCLEADLAAHARDVFADGKIHRVHYDLSHGEDFAWGFGLGCNGVIHLMLQRLEREGGFGFLETLDRAWQARHGGSLGLVTASSDPRHAEGEFALHCGAAYSAGDAWLIDEIRSHQDTGSPDGHDMSRRYWQKRIDSGQGQVEVLQVPVTPPPAVLICGAGHDAVPLARLVVEMGWNCTVVDHRSGFARAERFPARCDVRVLQVAELGGRVPLERIDAAVLMTHHLGHDRSYLEQVVGAGVPYIGLLGPRARRDQLLREIGDPDVHVFGPVGLDIGAEMPESIALAIVAEIHAYLNRRDGRMLTRAGV